MKGTVYEYPNPLQAVDESTRTTNDIAEYTGHKFGARVKLTIETIEKSILPLHVDPTDDATATEKRIKDRRLDVYVKAETTLSIHVKKVYSLMYGQCSALDQCLKPSPAT